MLTCIIIDDESDAIEGLSQLLESFINDKVNLIGTATNLSDGVSLIKDKKPDMIFLDIDMPEENGMAIYNYFPSPQFKVVFTTAYEQYAIDAIKKSATDYLLKPINFVELNDAISKVIKSKTKKQNQLEIEDKINSISPANTIGVDIMIPTQDGFDMENTKNIEYCKADGMYSIIYLYSGRQIMVSKPLKVLQELLSSKHFYKTHQSYLINIHYIRKFTRGDQSVVLLRSGVKIPIATRKVSNFTKDIQTLLQNNN